VSLSIAIRRHQTSSCATITIGFYMYILVIKKEMGRMGDIDRFSSVWVWARVAPVNHLSISALNLTSGTLSMNCMSVENAEMAGRVDFSDPSGLSGAMMGANTIQRESRV